MRCLPRLAICAVLVGGALPSWASCPPQLQWFREYNNVIANGPDWAAAVAVDAAGTVAVAGNETTGLGGGVTGLVMKYNPDGTNAWTAPVRIGGFGSSTALAVAIDAENGDVIVAGQESGGLIVQKLDPTGSLKWSRTFNAPGGEAAGLAVACDAGSVYVAGYVTAPGEGRNWLVQKYGPGGGALFWSRTYDSPAHADEAATAIAVGGGALYVAGYEVRTDLGQSANWLVRKYSLPSFGAGSGTLIWSQTYNSPANDQDQAAGVAVAPDGSVVVAGRENRPDLGQASNLLVRRYDTDGGLLGAVAWDSPAHGDDAAAAVAVDAGGRVLVAGSQRRPDLGQGLNWIILKYDAAFNLIWTDAANAPSNGDDAATGIAAGGGGYVVAGFDDRSDQGQDRNWLLERLTEPSPCPADVANGASTPVVLYPNPASGDRVTVGMKLTRDAATLDVLVYDLALHLVYKGSWDNVPQSLGGVTMNGVNHWPNGLYLLQVRATLADGTTQVFAPARLVVHR